MTPQSVKLARDELPANLRDGMSALSLTCLHAVGDLAALHARMLGLICSIRCPGSIVIKAFDAIRALRENGVVVIGGFHSPMERECLDILLRGDQPVVLCAARSVHGLKIGQRARSALDEGRLLLLSPFDKGVRRTTKANAILRNQLVAAFAEAVFVPHAAPGGKTWEIVEAACNRNQRVYSLEDQQNAKLIESGCEPLVFPFWRSVSRSSKEQNV